MKHNCISNIAPGHIKGTTVNRSAQRVTSIPSRLYSEAAMDIPFGGHGIQATSRSMVLGLTEPLTEMSSRKCFWEVEHGRRVRLTTSPPSVSPVVPNLWYAYPWGYSKIILVMSENT
jgi:hypothetical protein